MKRDESALRYEADIDLGADTAQARIARLVTRESRVLDLGCGTGSLARTLLTLDCKTTGVERDPTAAKIAQSVCENVLVADLDLVELDLSLEDQRFDVIIASDVLVHLRDPARLLGQLPALLAPGGHLLASFPNAAHGSIRLALLHGELPYSDAGLLDRTHLQLLNRGQIIDLVERSGFSTVHVEATTLALRNDEISYPDDELTHRVFEAVESDPEASSYQYVIVAFPGAPDEIGALARLLRRRQRESEARSEHIRTIETRLHETNLALTATSTQLDEMRREGLTPSDAQALAARIEGLTIELLDARDEVRRKDRDIETIKHLEGAREHALRESRDEVLELAYERQALTARLEEITESRMWRVVTAYRGHIAPRITRLRRPPT